ncbi:ATP-grasp domain-containing protein [Lysinibacillus xylanilyticus]|uniref:ATP-grasp domain-containing protein n=1 Tax=Lysinibacillus xylanilyticus TaxID=582475 RepID=UPI003D060211
MSILIFNRNADYQFDSWIADSNQKLIIFTTTNKMNKISKDKNIAHIEYFDDYENNNLLELRAVELNSKYNFEYVIATSEFDILRASKIREYLKINGQWNDSALAFRDKFIMKSILMQEEFLVPKFKKISNTLDILDFINQVGFPIIIKPIDGSGSENVAKIEDYNDLKNYLNDNKLNDKMVEEFIVGDLYHIDGLFLKNELIFSWPSRYINQGCLAHKSGKYTGSILLDPQNEMLVKLNNYAREILNTLPTPTNTVFHLEVFYSNNTLIFCEIACRRGGGYISKSIQEAFDIDLVKSSVQHQCNINTEIPHINFKKHTGFILIPNRMGKILEIPCKCEFEWVIDYKINGYIGMDSQDANSSVDSVAEFLVYGQNEEEVYKRLDSLYDWFLNNTKWDR